MAPVIYQHVFGLQVPVEHVVAVEVADSEDQLGGYELSELLIEELQLVEVLR